MAKSRATSVFSFKSTLVHIKGGLIHSVVYLPEEIVEQLPKGRVRTKGTINGIPFALAPQYQKDGGRFFTVNASLKKLARIKDGSKVEVSFRLVDPDLLDIPEELEAVLAQDEEAMTAWNNLTIGYQRSLILYVTSVKNVDSRIKRSLELVEKAKFGKLTGAKKTKPKPHP
jgi:hypothetical protein